VLAAIKIADITTPVKEPSLSDKIKARIDSVRTRTAKNNVT
jgi:hypothetical protein